MIYECKICDYTTNIQSTYSHHKKSKKHIAKVAKAALLSTQNHPMTQNDTHNDNIKKEHRCEYCKILFSRSDALSRHINKYCSKKEVTEIKNNCEKEIILKEKEILKQQLENAEKQIEVIKKEKEEEKHKLEEQLIYYRDVAFNKTENDSNMTNLNFLNTHFKDAPALEGPKDLHKLFNADKTANPDIYYRQLAQELGSHHRLNILHKVISDFIVKEYCKEDKMKQSVWNSDSSRLNYIIKECIQKDKIWIMDKNGKNLLDKVIKPIIEYIRVDVEKAASFIIAYHKNKKITFFDLNDHKALLEIGHNIMNKSLEEDILKELTGHFNINQKLLLKDIKEKKKDVKLITDKEEEVAVEIVKNDSKSKLINSISEIDKSLDKLRKDERKLDMDNTEDDNKGEKYRIIEEKKKELKQNKKELKKLLTEYDELDAKFNEVNNEEKDISYDTESEAELEQERNLKISRLTRKKNDLKNKKKDLDDKISNLK